MNYPKVITVSLLAAAILFSINGIVFADEAREAELLKRIDQLEKKVQILENKQSEKSEAATTPQSVVNKLSEVLKDISLTGFVDTSYVYNTNRPDSGLNTGRVFDTEANSFLLQSAKIALEKLPPKTGGVGFRTDLLVGEDAKVLNAATAGFDANSHFDLEQAYIDILAPLGKGLDIKAGKFVTLHGAEVIESKDNWNFSRSLLFGFAIPFTHTGIRASYPILDTLTGYLGISNGWDNVKDNNKGKSVESSLSWAPKDWLSFNLAGMYGPEASGNNHSNRGLIDFVATYKPFNKLTLKINTDYANEQDLVAAGKSATWSGIAGYSRYDFNDKWSLSDRIEYFSDPNGVRVVSGTPADYWENTSTLEFKPFKDLITRFEYRYDHATDNIYTIGSKVTDHQGSLGAEAIYVF